MLNAWRSKSIEPNRTKLREMDRSSIVRLFCDWFGGFAIGSAIIHNRIPVFIAEFDY